MRPAHWTVTRALAVTAVVVAVVSARPPPPPDEPDPVARLQFLEGVLSADRVWEPVLSQRVTRLPVRLEPASVTRFLDGLLYVADEVPAFAVIEAVVGDHARTGTLVEYATSVFRAAFACMALKHVALEQRLLSVFLDFAVADPDRYYDHFDEHEPRTGPDADRLARQLEQRRDRRAGDHARRWLRGLVAVLSDVIDGMAAVADYDRLPAVANFYHDVDALVRDPRLELSTFPADAHFTLQRHQPLLLAALSETCVRSPVYGFYDTLGIELDMWLLPGPTPPDDDRFVVTEQSAFRMLERGRAQAAAVFARLPIRAMTAAQWTDLWGHVPSDADRWRDRDPFYDRFAVTVR